MFFNEKIIVMIRKHVLRIAIVAILLSGATMANAQTTGMAINTTGSAANSSAMLDVASTSSPFKGLLIPRVSNTNMNSITVNASNVGLMVYNTTLAGFYYWNGSAWTQIGDGAGTGSAGGDLTGNYPNPTISSSATTGDNIVTAINASTGGLDGTRLARSSVSVNAMSATGTRNSTTFLRGDNIWATISGGSGTVTSVSSGSLTPIFQTTVSNATTTPTINYSLNNAPIFSVLTNSTGAISTPVYGKVHPSALLNLGGTANSTTFYRGDGQWITPTVAASYVFNGALNMGASTPRFVAFPFSGSLQTTVGSAGLPMSTACTLDAMYVSGGIITPGGSGDNTITLTLYKNGVAQTMLVSLAALQASPGGTVISASDLVHTVSVSVGDLLSVQISQTNGGGPNLSANVSFHAH